MSRLKSYSRSLEVEWKTRRVIFNSEFSFSYSGYRTKFNEVVYPTIYQKLEV